MGAKANKRKRQKQRRAAAAQAAVTQPTATTGATQPAAGAATTGSSATTTKTADEFFEDTSGGGGDWESILDETTSIEGGKGVESGWESDEFYQSILDEKNAAEAAAQKQAQAEKEALEHKQKIIDTPRSKEWYKTYGGLVNDLESGKGKEIANKFLPLVDEMDEFRAKAANAKTNVQASIDAKRQFLKDTKNFKTMNYDELRQSFSSEQYTKALDGMFSGYKYNKARLLDAGSSFMNTISFGYLGSKRGRNVQRYKKEAFQDAMESYRSKAEIEISNLQKMQEAISKNDSNAIRAGQKSSATIDRYANMRARATESAAEKSGIKGALKGAGGKLAAFGAVLGLGAVIGNMFSGGHRSNAELYNPNGYSQYYS